MDWSRPIAKWMVAAAAAAGAAACASGGDKEVRAGCPTVGILAETDRIVKRAPGRADGLLYEAQMQAADLDCDIDDDQIALDIDVTMTATAGAAARSQPYGMPIFVAVVSDGRMLGKTIYSARADFGTARSVEVRHAVRGLMIQRPSAQTAGGYEILVGFDLTPDELTYNRTGQP